LVSDVLRWFPGIPDEMKEGIPILVVWLRA
jgi:hypothetical protein